MKSKTKSRTRFLRFLLVLAILLGAVTVYFILIAVDRPPRIDDLSSLKARRINRGDNTLTLGNNWLRKSESGLWEMYLEGEPFERGVAFGRLTRELLYYQESVFVEQIRELVPSDGYLKILKYFIAFFNRNLDKHIPVEFLEEIYGTSVSTAREYDFIGSGYQRQLNYHAAHDIGHALQGLNLVACTSFSLWDGRSTDSCLLVGRNFDFYMGPKFAENKIVAFVNPSRGNKFMMITWADMIGVVSGMNDQGLTVTLNAAKSTIPRQAATPVTLLAREILQYASTIEEAYAISKKRKLFVSESIMIGSAKDHRTAIIEKSPARDDLVMPVENRIICTNHYQGSVFATDKANLSNIRGSDSRNRYLRVRELLDASPPAGVEGVVNVLRDQRGLGNTDLGMGNQLAINQLIAHHSVVFKPDSLLVWVSAGPWQEGKYVAYDLKRVFGTELATISAHHEIAELNRTVAPDTFMVTPDFERFRSYQEMSLQLSVFQKEGKALPEGFEEAFTRSNPSLYLTWVKLGDYFESAGEPAKAVLCYTESLRRILPGKDDELKIKEKLAACQK